MELFLRGGMRKSVKALDSGSFKPLVSERARFNFKRFTVIMKQQRRQLIKLAPLLLIVFCFTDLLPQRLCLPAVFIRDLIQRIGKVEFTLAVGIEVSL